MGVFNLVCPASGLGLSTEAVYLLFVAEDRPGAFVPIAPPIAGRYDAYGAIEDIEQNAIAKQVLAGFAGLKQQGAFAGAATIPNTRKLDSLIGDIRQGQVDDAWTAVGEAHVGFVLVLRSIFDAALKTVRGTPSGKELEASLKKAPFDQLLDRAVGARAIADKLVAETPPFRTALVELALFREWFTRIEGSWTPEPVGDQLGAAEFRKQAEEAKRRFAPSPALLAAVKVYASSIDDEDEDDDQDDRDDDVDLADLEDDGAASDDDD